MMHKNHVFNLNNLLFAVPALTVTSEDILKIFILVLDYIEIKCRIEMKNF